MIDKTKPEYKKYELICIAPVHIGSGETLRKFEYFYNKKKQLIYFMDKPKWANFLIENDLLDNYILSMEKMQGGFSLDSWLRHQNINDLDKKIEKISVSKAIAYPNTDAKTSLNDIACQIKTVQGTPYIPGSSIKGALRTGILYHLIKKNPYKYQYIWQNIKDDIKAHQGKKIKSNKLERTAFTMPSIDEKARTDDALQSVMRGLRISDAFITSDKKNTVIIQKLDNSQKKRDGMKEHFISLFRECIPVGTKLQFSVTMDKKMLQYIGINSLDEVWQAARKYTEASLKMQQAVFGKIYSNEFKEAELADLFLGGGTGFLSKTVYYALAPNQAEGKNILASYFDDVFRGKNAHHHMRDDDMITPRALKLAKTDSLRYLMGLASVKEVR